jgi:hypothetical protein
MIDRRAMRRACWLVALGACGTPHRHGGGLGIDAAGGGGGGGGDALAAADSPTTGHDAAAAHDAAALDGAAHTDAAASVITGGPCASGAHGAAAFRIRWTNAGGTAAVAYEVDGLPDKTRDHAGAFGFQIGFVPQFVDPFLAHGGLQLDGSDFVDLELSTVGVAHVASATLALYGRSFDTTTSGSFNWQTFVGTGATPTDFVSNVAPYAWYAADMTTELAPNDAGTLIRIKAGPSSGVLVVNRIELCMDAS